MQFRTKMEDGQKATCGDHRMSGTDYQRLSAILETNTYAEQPTLIFCVESGALKDSKNVTISMFLH